MSYSYVLMFAMQAINYRLPYLPPTRLVHKFLPIDDCRLESSVRNLPVE